MRRRAGDRVIRVSMTVCVIGVAGVAAWVSYWHAVEVIRRYGAENASAVYLIPLTIDGMIYASSMSMLWSARYQLKVRWLPRTALVVGIAATLAANVLQGLEHGSLAAAIAAWPAVALIISYELTIWVVRSGREIADREAVSPAEQGPEGTRTGPGLMSGEVVEAVAPVEETAVVPAQPLGKVEPTATGRKATSEDKVAQGRERLGQARVLDARHRAERGRPISAENLAKAMRIGKPQALELVRTVRREIAQAADDLAHSSETVGASS